MSVVEKRERKGISAQKKNQQHIPIPSRSVMPGLFHGAVQS
jgi:hypothetical protein